MNFFWLTVSTVAASGLYLVGCRLYSIWTAALGWADFSEGINL